jgi:GPH family glycoside/pentoside/hexuronide:cation symporter
MFKKKPTASEVDGVQYRRAKLWQIICYACNGLVGMSVYSLIGMASYSASIGYGITTAAVGIILTCSRILDGITDPLLAFVYDRVNTKFGKLRILLVAGYLIEALALYGMFTGFSSKGLGLPVFALLYVLYIIGYTVSNMTAQTIPSIMTNDPHQRPTIGVWTTAFNYLVPMAMSMIFNVVLLPKCGGTYNQAFLSAACNMTLIAAGIGTVLVCLGVSAYDKPETFVGTKKSEPLKMSDIVEVLKHNRPLQCYIASNASDKLAQQVGSQAIIGTLLNGILIGNMGLATILTVISMIPSIFFAAFGAKYVGKHGSKKGIVSFTCISMVIIVIDPKQIGVMGSPAMIIYVVLSLLQNGSNMCITTSNTSYMADAIDFELDRSGRYIPAVVSGTYSLVDKLITSFAAVIATGAVALLGYTTTMPQPTDPSTPAIFWMTMVLKFALPIIGWIITLVAMRSCPLTKEEMVNVQKRIAEKKAAAQSEFYKEQLQ